jgi:AmiR/NasT family two-component response regulator
LFPWPFKAAIQAGRPIVDDLAGRYPNLSAGPWPANIKQAVVSVLLSNGPRLVSYIFIAGLSPRLVLDDDYREFIELIGEEMAAALGAARSLEAERERASNLQVALLSNRHIGAAIGVLMALHKISEDQAFKMLVKTSQESRRKLREVADDVTRTGALPESQS